MKIFVQYNRKIVSSGDFVVSADITYTGENQEIKADLFYFMIGENRLTIKKITEKNKQIHFDFNCNDQLFTLKFDMDKFVNVEKLPQIMVHYDIPLEDLEVEISYKADPILNDFEHKVIQTKRIQFGYNLYSADNSDAKSPLVIFLHGSGERGFNNNLPLLANDIPKKVYNYMKKTGSGVLVVPQTTWSADMTGWFRAEFQESLKQLINKTIVEHKIDRNRVYLIGLSNGASASWYLAQKFPEMFAAVVPCSGYVYNEGKEFLGEKGQGRYMTPTDEEAKKLLNVPIWAFHGENDPTVNVLGTKLIVNKIKKFGGNNVKETIYPKGALIPNPHASWSLAFKENDVIDWLFSQNKEKVLLTKNN